MNRHKCLEAIASQQDDAELSGREGLSARTLRLQNSAFAGTGGVSRNNARCGFAPAFIDTRTGQTVRSRFADGRPAPVHVLEGLPGDWIAARDERGAPTSTAPSVVAGFVRDGVFYTREQAAQTVAQQTTETGRHG